MFTAIQGIIGAIIAKLGVAGTIAAGVGSVVVIGGAVVVPVVIITNNGDNKPDIVQDETTQNEQPVENETDDNNEKTSEEPVKNDEQNVESSDNTVADNSQNTNNTPEQPSQPEPETPIETPETQPEIPKADYNLNDRYLFAWGIIFFWDKIAPERTLMDTRTFTNVKLYEGRTGDAFCGPITGQIAAHAKANGWVTYNGCGAFNRAWEDIEDQSSNTPEVGDTGEVKLTEAVCAQWGLSCGRW